LPGVERIPVATLRKLEDFARNGNLDRDAAEAVARARPGRQGRARPPDSYDCASALRRLVSPAHFVDDERQQLATLLAKSLAPDVASSSPAPISASYTAARPSRNLLRGQYRQPTRANSSGLSCHGNGAGMVDPFTARFIVQAACRIRRIRRAWRSISSLTSRVCS